MILRDICESRFQLTEAKERAGVLGVVEGVFFVANEPSRNGRVYPKGLWENVLRSEDVQRLLQNRLMIGTVGHEDVDFDALIREQKVSHVVTKLWLGEDGKGYGRAEILDTPVGKILYTLLKSGSKMAVSSKGWGDYKGTNEDGLYVVDESSYILERFDFVVDPGFISAVPGLKQQYESLVCNKEKKEVSGMDMTEAIIKEKLQLQERLNEVMEELKKTKQEKEELEKKLKEAQEKSKADASKVIKVKSLIEQRLKKVAESWIGTSNVAELMQEIKKIGHLVEKEADLLVKSGVDAQRLKGESLSEVLLKVFNENKRLKRRALVERNLVRERAVNTKIKILEARNRRLEKLLREAKGVVSAVNNLGGIKKITESLIKARRIIKRMTEQKLNEEIERLSAKYGVSVADVKALIERVGIKKAESLLKTEKSRKVAESRDVVIVREDESRVIDESLAGRILKTYNFGVKQ